MPGKATRWLGFVSLAAATIACEPPTDPIPDPQPRLVIHAVLDAGAYEQWVKVELLDGSFGHRLVGLAGADVTITAPDGTVFTGTLLDTVTYNGFPLQGYRVPLGRDTPLIPGGTYTLRVRVLGQEVTGSTTLPQFAPEPEREFVEQFVRARDTLKLSWNRVPLAARYEVVIQHTFQHQTQEIITQTYRAFSDTAITIAGTARTFENDEVFQTGRRATVLVSAVDDNYYSYYHLNVDPFAGAPPSRLTGAVGVFGSTAPVRMRIYDLVR